MSNLSVPSKPQKIDSKPPKLTKMAKKVLKGFNEINQPISADALSKKLNLPIRSVRYGINLLIKQGLVRKYQNLQDMRTTLYAIPKNTGDDSQNN